MDKFYQNQQLEGLINFSAASDESISPFGEALLEILEAYYGEEVGVDEAILDLTNGLRQRGIDAEIEDVIEIITGEDVPSPETVEALQDLCEDVSDDEVDAFEYLLDATAETYELAGLIDDEEEDYEDFEDFEEDEEFEEDEDESPIPVSYEYDDFEDAYEDEDEYEDQYRNEAVDELLARQIVADELGNLEGYASDLVEAGHMPPIAYSLMFGDESTDAYMEFSRVCQEQSMTPESQIQAIEYALDLFSKCGPIMNFSQRTVEDIQFSSPINDIVDEEAAEMFQLMKERQV
jgi:hypothetical protein